MSQTRPPSSPTSAAARANDDPLREIRHDVRHSLYVLDLAMNVLEGARTDPQRFAEVIQMVRKEQATIETLVDRLLKLAAGSTPD